MDDVLPQNDDMIPNQLLSYHKFATDQWKAAAIFGIPSKKQSV
jgi:hypothetical protein